LQGRGSLLYEFSKTKITQEKINVGVDTGKYQLDIYVRPLDIYFTVTNDEKGISKAISDIKNCVPPARIIIEATGGLEPSP
jgi:transposase